MAPILSFIPSKVPRLVTIMLILIVLVSTAGIALYVGLLAYRDMFPASWPANRVNLVVSTAASFLGSVPLLLFGATSIQKLRNLAEGPRKPATVSEGLDMMIGDLSKALICIRFGDFSTKHKKYDQIMDLSHGKEHIWDYHIYRPYAHDPKIDLTEFYEIDNDEVKKVRAFNSQLVHIVSDSEDLYNQFYKHFNLLGYSDILITGTYKNDDRKQSLIELDDLEPDQLTIDNVAIFFQYPTPVRLIPPEQHSVFLGQLRKIADRDRDGNTVIIFPSLESGARSDNTDPVAEGQKLYDLIKNKRLSRATSGS